MSVKTFIQSIHEMSSMELLELVLENPELISSSYFSDIGNAIRERYATLEPTEQES